jgi:glycosyltransferase involved in cell wall biosynthesis
MKNKAISVLGKLFGKKKKAFKRDFKVSAYLSIYNDWDILEETLKSVKGYIDELIIVDGAYEWMEGFVSNLGWNPAKSHNELYTIIDRSGIPYKSISKTWKNEVEKRTAGYAACDGDYVWRIDADEIYFYHQGNLEKFYKSGMAVAEMEMPMYLSPEYIVKDNNLAKLPCQCFIFNRALISPELHLNYLWLVLTLDELPLGSQKTPFRVFERPIAFNAHLTNFRSTKTSIVRGSFYNINWMRENGVSWSDLHRNKILRDPKVIFQDLTPTEFLETIKFGAFTVGLYKMKGNESVILAPLINSQIETIRPIFESFKHSLKEHYEKSLTSKCHLISNTNIYFDLACLPESLQQKGAITLKIDHSISHTAAKVIITSTTEPFFYEIDPVIICDEKTITVHIPNQAIISHAINAVLELSFGFTDDVRHTKFLIC